MTIHLRKFDKIYTRERLIQELKALGERLELTPTTRDICSGSKQGKCASIATYQTEFGDIPCALKAAGFEAGRRRGKSKVFTKEELIEKIISLRLELGRRVIADDVKLAHRTSKFPSVETLRTHFGSVDMALIKAERVFRERRENGEHSKTSALSENDKSSSD